jgi:hypothetical protein
MLFANPNLRHRGLPGALGHLLSRDGLTIYGDFLV